jgi:hypothetical protein
MRLRWDPTWQDDSFDGSTALRDELQLEGQCVYINCVSIRRQPVYSAVYLPRIETHFIV